MKKIIHILLSINVCFISVVTAQSITTPPQNMGLPYTKSARSIAIEAIKNVTALFVGGRYAYVNGYKVRLDTIDILRSEAIKRNNSVFVPIAFAGVIAQEKCIYKPIPNGLEILQDKWVYDVNRMKITIPSSIATITKNNIVYFDIIAYAAYLKKKTLLTPRGLLLIADTTIQYNQQNKQLDDCVITLFDTPEKFADPAIATEYIPTLKRQGAWTDYVKVTPAQMQILQGEETNWKFTPTSAYNYDGFNKTLLGSKVPAPGVFPRILFSSEDIPMLAKRLTNSKLGQMSMIEIEYLFKNSWWNENTSDGKIFKQLYTGNLANLQWPENTKIPNAPPTDVPHQFKDQKPGIYSSHISYVPECLTNMALYCLLTNDNEHGKQAATAIANYFKLREPFIDEWLMASETEMATSYTKADEKILKVDGNGATTTWRNLHGVVAHMNLGLALDFAGKWMSEAEKEIMVRIIAKATYGRRAYSQDGPIRFRDINWATWDLPNFLAITAIEGLTGFDKEVYAANAETVKAFCEWGIDDNGVVYESNGKTPGGFQFHTLSMIALARRGDNLWGHPHVRKLLQAQVLMTSPNGKVVVNSGTQYIPFSQQYLSLQTVNMYKAFYPNNIYADYLLSQPRFFADKNDEFYRHWLLDDFNASDYKKKVASLKRLRMPSPTYPGFVHSFLYDTDFEVVSREKLQHNLAFNAPTHGVFSAYSNHTDTATWMNMMVRPNHYLGGGHHHADAGMFHFSALGVDWFTESPFPQAYDGKFHNQVLVDGKSQPEAASGLGTGYQAAATYMGAIHNNNAAFATADLTNSYTYRWQTQPSPIWEPNLKALQWELDPSPNNLKMFAGTARYKMRPWWATYNYSNYIATSRALFNPMKYVYRTTGLVRGKHCYGLIIDDLQKDSLQHHYQWTAMLNGGVWQANVSNLQPNQIVLAKRNYQATDTINKPAIQPIAGEPMLLVTYLTEQTLQDSSVQVRSNVANRVMYMAKTNWYQQLEVNTTAVQANFRILFIPFKYGEDLPLIKYHNNIATIQWKNSQVDTIEFKENKNRTQAQILRNSKTIITTK